MFETDAIHLGYGCWKHDISNKKVAPHVMAGTEQFLFLTRKLNAEATDKLLRSITL